MNKYEIRKQFGNDEDIKVLMKHNSLVKAKYNLTLVQNRVFELLLYKFQKERKGILSCEIHRNEFRDLIGKEKEKTIKGISDLLESLRLKEILIAEKIEDKNTYRWYRFGLINGSIYDEERDIFIVKATEEIYSLIKDYYDKREGHTPVNLIVKLSLNNYYAMRLYDLIRVWSGTKQVINYKVDELKELLQIETKYTLYGDFKRRVIIPAIKELNKTGYFEIDFKENKVGRKVSSIDFIVKDLDKRKYFTKDIVSEVEALEEVCISVDDDVSDKTKEKEKLVVSEVFVPDEDIFTKGTLRRLKIDFKDIDFRNEYMKRAFDDAIMITLERDDTEKIKANSYKFFKGTLDNKIAEYRKEEELDIKHKEEMSLNW